MFTKTHWWKVVYAISFCETWIYGLAPYPFNIVEYYLLNKFIRYKFGIVRNIFKYIVEVVLYELHLNIQRAVPLNCWIRIVLYSIIWVQAAVIKHRETAKGNSANTEIIGIIFWR